jgi:DNA-directed RNA polymerase specialized sigma24 family protein
MMGALDRWLPGGRRTGPTDRRVPGRAATSGDPAREGNTAAEHHAAFMRLVLRHVSHVETVVARCCGDAGEQEEIVREVFVRAYFAPLDWERAAAVEAALEAIAQEICRQTRPGRTRGPGRGDATPDG